MCVWLLAACTSSAPAPEERTPVGAAPDLDALDARFEEIVSEYQVATAGHGGSDWSEHAMVYFDVDRRDGLVLFLNGPSGTSVEALIDGMNALDPGSRIAMLYRGWVDAYNEKLKRRGHALSRDTEMPSPNHA